MHECQFSKQIKLLQQVLFKLMINTRSDKLKLFSTSSVVTPSGYINNATGSSVSSIIYTRLNIGSLYDGFIGYLKETKFHFFFVTLYLTNKADKPRFHGDERNYTLVFKTDSTVLANSLAIT